MNTITNIILIGLLFLFALYILEVKADNLHWKKVECAYENSKDSQYIISECVERER